ncbi:bifunctional 3-(3-hydroxy-phenyl)propionate/3-hydroxycinnamic acid hydroxylase [Pseudomonas aeruginosa]|uniref:bifunctional 3-(3-hydroxy-phenyl)propionate/3-hydroxycinnamic acid hydroxylase n=1 Tax=Pseudomonas aeruginosa TaxID=287 RepID=UPI0015541F18|nr:bifunctional 3-(3-hydroxy-phenyl)propionate/3-hydroxycinnamic acid hydroxylase [Pseudomonas aeruginosa]QKF01632.1 bifunctional 3-(3-hydroxy-phenyl)propionate/3-hydroxycinnamic acid hydroxylase [Pseudomonas aeruginosa]HCF1525220.1 bifunctional 3-(3-hydroxy-phenyl)propionate/3-hydroxycinnamic acid hydroxylase [Pseudomonas aeruginosa]
MSDHKPSLTCDVLISGYGPSGATLANLLGLRGFNVVVVERDKEIYDKPRAITADHEVMRIFQECGLAEEIMQSSIPHPGSDYIGLDNQIIKRLYPAPPPLSLTWDPTWLFVQPELEATLRRGVDRFQCVSTFLGHELVSFTQDDTGVRASVRRMDSDDFFEVTARYLVACDGGRSTVRKLLKSTVENLDFDEWWIVADARLRGELDLPKRATHYCHPWRPGSFVIGPGDLRRWEVKILPGENPASFESDEAFLQVLSNFVDISKIELWRKAIYCFHALVVDEWRCGCVFLMGDAAHQTPPFLGQGLCAGIRDAANLAWKLDAVERKGFPSTLLDTYGEERKPHVRQVVASAKEIGLIIGELDMEAARKRDALLGEQIASGKAETIRQKFVPGLETGLLGKDPQGRLANSAGEVFVQPWVKSGGNVFARMDDLVEPGFAVFTTSRELFLDLSEEARRIMRRFDIHLVQFEKAALAPARDQWNVLHLEEQSDLAFNWFRDRHVQAVLVRPDHYVFGAAADAAALDGLLRQLAAHAPATEPELQ